MFIPSKPEETRDWSQYTLILPAVSIGNVGQLTVDLILSSVDIKHVGYFYDDCFLALVGCNPFCSAEDNKCSKSLVTGVEVYENAANRLLIVQQRVPLKKNKKLEFCRKLIDWIELLNFKLVVLLSSSSAHERIDSQILGTPFRYLSTPEYEKHFSLKDNLGWYPLERRLSLPSPSILECVSGKEPQELYIPAGGITKLLYQECCKNAIPFVAVLKFCSEGDNIPDALALASHLNQWIRILQVAEGTSDTRIQQLWRLPVSWNLMFGSSAPVSMY